jgi:hypothetical protein
MSTAPAEKRVETWEERARDVLTATLIHLEELNDALADSDGSPVDAHCAHCARAPVPKEAFARCLCCQIREVLK